MLDTRWDAQRCLNLWQDWLDDAQRPRLLHLVALCAQVPSAKEVRVATQSHAVSCGLAEELARALWGLLPGFHRISLQGGQFLLTLCIGPTQALLREQQFAADAVVLDLGPESEHTPVWDRWGLKSLARCCQRGAPVSLVGDASTMKPDLVQNGFVETEGAWQYNPPWQTRHNRDAWRSPPMDVARCTVVGAGLAGAAVAAALARRGWQVTVLDAQESPAGGASGLPAGLLVAHVSADDSPRSRLARAGVRMMLAQAHDHLVRDQDWAPRGVVEHRLDGRSGLPLNWPAAEAQDWANLGASDDLTASNAAQALHHKPAGWIKPAKMVQAWLATPGVRFVGRAHVKGLTQEGAHWNVIDAQGRTLACAELVVLANAQAALPLLQAIDQEHPEYALQTSGLPAQTGMRGVVSWAIQCLGDDQALPELPVNGQGSLIPHVPTASGLSWYLGATYEDARHEAQTLAQHHASNLNKLVRLLPDVAQHLAPRFASKEVQSWTGVRCVSDDRMPVVGALQSGPQPNLWVSAAMGSRGLSFAYLCAELLAARLGAEPLPVEASLAASLLATRQAK